MERSRALDIATLVVACLGIVTLFLPFLCIPLTLLALGVSGFRWVTRRSRTSLNLYALLVSASAAVFIAAVTAVSLTTVPAGTAAMPVLLSV